MFEEYLEDAHYFASKARRIKNEREAKRYYRAAVLSAIAALEAFMSYLGVTFSHGGGKLKDYEVAFLLDKRFGLRKQKPYEISELTEYHRLEDKVGFLISKFLPRFDFAKDRTWVGFHQLKDLRDLLAHPKGEEDPTSIKAYERGFRSGFSSTVQIMNNLCLGIFKQPLRRKILDLLPDNINR